MKHSRKMVLVDINSVNQQGSGTDTNNKDLTKAITSLANSAEFSRSYYGQNAVSISRLNNEISEILERKDLDPHEKLKLYSQGLTILLFLHRQSEKTSYINTEWKSVYIQPCRQQYQFTISI